MVLDIWSAVDRIFCHFGPFFPFYPPNDTKNQNFEKNEKQNWRYHQFTQGYQKS